jgi:hypothetical protein
MEANFLSSLEYVQNHGGGPGQAWVEGMYRDLLGREADAAGRDNWLAQLAAGTDPIQVAYGIAASREREALRVRDNYWIYLGRAATDGEVNFWVDRFILDGARNEDVVGGFVGSAEFFNNLGRGQGNRTAWVQSAYRHLLHRSVAADEVAQWLRAMN